jgi:hypothetical protein
MILFGIAMSLIVPLRAFFILYSKPGFDYAGAFDVAHGSISAVTL